MREREYIDVSNKQAIWDARQALANVVPASSDGIIDREEFKSVVASLQKWQDALFARIEQHMLKRID